MSVLSDHAAALRQVLDAIGELDDALHSAASAIATAFADDGKLLAAGNGGSAAEAQHLTSELVGRLHPASERAPLAAIALHADTSTVTALSNDYGYDSVFARQIEAIGRPGDALVVLSTSGASPNLVRAVDVANGLGIVTVGLLGRGPKALHDRCRHVLAVPSENQQAVQECHLVLVHALVEQIEVLLAGEHP